MSSAIGGAGHFALPVIGVKYFWIKLNLDWNYSFPNDLASSGIPFGVKSIRKRSKLEGQGIPTDKNLLLCLVLTKRIFISLPMYRIYICIHIMYPINITFTNELNTRGRRQNSNSHTVHTHTAIANNTPAPHAKVHTYTHTYIGSSAAVLEAEGPTPAPTF